MPELKASAGIEEAETVGGEEDGAEDQALFVRLLGRVLEVKDRPRGTTGRGTGEAHPHREVLAPAARMISSVGRAYPTIYINAEAVLASLSSSKVDETC